jgi:hypothetical protein
MVRVGVSEGFYESASEGFLDDFFLKHFQIISEAPPEALQRFRCASD